MPFNSKSLHGGIPMPPGKAGVKLNAATFGELGTFPCIDRRDVGSSNMSQAQECCKECMPESCQEGEEFLN